MHRSDFPMTDDRKQLIHSLFCEAIALGDSEVDSFLDFRCRDDVPLKQSVLQLLDQDRELETLAFLKHPPADLSTAASSIDSMCDKQLGPWKLSRHLGSGGMGDVYLGSRVGDFQQLAAIKLIRSSVSGEKVERRFRHEMQFLASLGKHPGITSILDAGTTDSGQPYIAMEFVDGQRITDYCDSRNMPIRQRLELFCKACEAVQFAHQNAVLHRDIKPGNLLVTESGQPMLIDFGVAKLTADESANSLHVTQTQQPFSPGFSSPEQLNGQPTATTSDVYSLGVILYELLTGRMPHQFDGQSLADIVNAVCNGEAIRPSEIVLRKPTTQAGQKESSPVDPEAMASRRGSTPKRLQSMLRNDLDRIVSKAIDREPSSRYQTVQQLSEDIQRYLQGLPVLARGDGALYRLKKFTQRNKVAVAVGLSILLLLVGGIAITSRFAILAERSAQRATESAEAERQQRLLAEKREKTANQIAELFESMIERANPARFGGKKFLVRDLLEDLAIRVQSDEIAEPLVRARLLRSLAASYRGLGEFGLCHRYLKSAIGILETELGASHFQTLETRVQRAESRLRYGSPGGAKPELQEVLIAMGASGSNDPKLDNLRFKATLLLGDALRGTNELEAAEKTLNDAAQLASNPSERYSVKRSQSRLDFRQGKFERALAFATNDLLQKREKYGNDDHTTATASQFVGAILTQLERHQEAEEFHKDCLDTTRKLHGNDHVETLRAVMNLAITYFNQQDFEASEALFREYAEIAVRIKHYRGPHHHRMLVRWAQCLREVGNLEEAKSVLDSCQNFIAKYPSTHQSNLSELKIEFEKLAEAMKLGNAN